MPQFLHFEGRAFSHYSPNAYAFTKQFAAPLRPAHFQRTLRRTR